MDETVNTIGVANGDPKQTLSDDLMQENDKIDSSTANNVTKCTEDSPNLLIIVASNTDPGDSQGHVDKTDKYIIKSQALDCSPVITNESPTANDNLEDVGNNPQIQVLTVEVCVDSTDGKESSMIVLEETGRDSDPSTTELTVDMNSPVEPSNVTVVIDDKIENIESELSILTGDSFPPPLPNPNEASLNNGQEMNSPVENENIISELSVIHGEETENTAHNGGNLNRFPFRLTTDDIQKSYDKNAPVRSHESSLVDTLLTFIDGKGKNDTSQETAVMDNLDLLAILEGGADSPSPIKEENHPLRRDILPKKYRKSLVNMDPALEKSLALKQLKELPTRKKMKEKRRIVDVKIPKVFKGPALMGRQRTANKSASEEKTSDKISLVPHDSLIRKDVPVKTYSKKNASNDISNLINDWSDDDANKETPDQTVAESSTKEPTPKVNITLPQESTAETPKSQDVSKSDSFVEPIPKRVSRVIKKKVIYDPDNPDSYKFASSIIRKDTPNKKNEGEQDENAKVNDRVQKTSITKPKPKVSVSKVVADREEEPLVKVPKRASISPINKKKILNTSLSKKKKLTEVDRLLMDEGAVNMMYQLERSNNGSDVPELALKPNKKSLISLSKERKALVSKAKIIKQSVMSQSNDDSSIKLMRVRKESKTSTSLEVAAAKVAGLRSSMQSPSLSEMSAAGNESKIIRRHSSSSFSSGGLSPRPQSPILERKGRKNTSNISLDQSHLENDSGIQSSTPLAPGEVLKAKGLLLPSLVKRKRKSLEIMRASVRQKKVKVVKKLDTENRVISSLGAGLGKLSSFTQLTIDISDNIAHIVVKPTGNTEELYDLQVCCQLFYIHLIIRLFVTMGCFTGFRPQTRRTGNIRNYQRILPNWELSGNVLISLEYQEKLTIK